MKKKLVAALACRVGGSRLYGKPLQRLVGEATILDQILDTIQKLPFIETSVLGISEGQENLVFVDVAKKRGIPYIFGDQKDVLKRLILCGRIADATDVFRITTECPFLWYENLESSWNEHVANRHDITVTDGAPEGVNWEIYSMDALNRCHDRGDVRHRSEFCSLYAREHIGEFRARVIRPPKELDRLDIRLTVDQPEDLVLCRRIAEHFKDKLPLVPITDIIRFIDERPLLADLVEPYVDPHRIWPDGNV